MRGVEQEFKGTLVVRDSIVRRKDMRFCYRWHGSRMVRYFLGTRITDITKWLQVIVKGRVVHIDTKGLDKKRDEVLYFDF